jgi:hypothetical protein
MCNLSRDRERRRLRSGCFSLRLSGSYQQWRPQHFSICTDGHPLCRAIKWCRRAAHGLPSPVSSPRRTRFPPMRGAVPALSPADLQIAARHCRFQVAGPIREHHVDRLRDRHARKRGPRLSVSLPSFQWSATAHAVRKSGPACAAALSSLRCSTAYADISRSSGCPVGRYCRTLWRVHFVVNLKWRAVSAVQLECPQGIGNAVCIWPKTRLNSSN